MKSVADRIGQFIRQDVQSMHAYAIQPSTGMVKLDAMENPYSLPDDLRQALGQRLGEVAINRYPGARIEELKQALSTYANVPAGHGLMLGNGSDELISLMAMACDVPGGTLLAPEPGFVMYAMSAQLQGLKYVGVPLTPEFELDEAAMLAAMAQHQPAIVYLAFPNNPTANLWDVEVMRRIIAAAPGLVVIDEAYQPFSSRSWISEIHANPEANAHVLLMRTLSKFGLAGVRLGYMTARLDLLEQVDKLRPPYNISVLNAECALFALEHADVFAAQAQAICAQRDELYAALQAMPGVTPFRSDANMMLVRVPDAAKVFESLKARRILVKNISKMHPLLAQCLRLTVGTPEENRLMLAALRESL